MSITYTSPDDGWTFTSTSVGLFDPGNYSNVMAGNLPQYDHLSHYSESSTKKQQQLPKTQPSLNSFVVRDPQYPTNNLKSKRQSSLIFDKKDVAVSIADKRIAPEIIKLAKEKKLDPTLIEECERTANSTKLADCAMHRGLLNQINNLLNISTDPFISVINNVILHYLDHPTNTLEGLATFEEEMRQKVIDYNNGETVKINGKEYTKK